MKIILLFILSFCLINTALGIPDTKKIWGKYEITIRDNAWSLNYNGKPVICKAGASLEADSNILPGTLVKADFDSQRGELTLVHRCGSWDLVEIVQFNAQKQEGLIERRFEFTYHGGEIGKITQIRSDYEVPKGGDYLVPTAFGAQSSFKTDRSGTPIWDEKIRYGNTGGLPVGSTIGTPTYCEYIFLGLPDNRSLFFLPYWSKDPGHMLLLIGKDSVEIKMNIGTYGWAYPEKKQSTGPLYLQIALEPLEKAVNHVVHDWYKAIGIKAPADRPDYVKDAIIFEVNPRKEQDRALERIGKERIPELRQIGFNTMWIMPVMEGRESYYPGDYYKLCPYIGTPAEYRKMVDDAHKAGVRIWQDIVPHGGGPREIVRRPGANAKMIIYNAKGDTEGREFCSYSEPEWQKYMHDVASFYTAAYHLDGFRIDRVDGAGASMRRRGFPSSDSPLTGLDKEWFQKSLEEMGGELPDISYERASLDGKEGGRLMIRAIRDGARGKNREASILAESIYSPTAQEADAIYDVQITTSVDWLSGMEAQKFVPLYSQWLQDQRNIDPLDCLRMRRIACHDSIKSRPILGLGLERAFIASAYFMTGLPQLYLGMELGNGSLLKRLAEVRQERDELRMGDADYFAVKVSDPAIWSVLRFTPEQASMGLVNFDSCSHHVDLRLPVEKLPISTDKVYDLVNLMNGKLLASGKPEALSRTTLELFPYEAVLLAFQPLRQNTATAIPQTAAIERKTVKAQQIEDGIVVSGTSYQMTIDRISGAITSFVHGDLKFSSALITAKKVEASPAKVSVSKTENGISISVSRKIGNGMMKIDYLCDASDVRVETQLSDVPEGAFAALAFPFEHAARYSIRTMNGNYDGLYLPPAGPNGLHSGIFRNNEHEVLYDSEINLPDYNDAAITVFAQDGNAIRLRVTDALRNAPAKTVALREFGNRSCFTPVYFYRAPGPLTEGAAERFAFTISTRTSVDIPLYEELPKVTAGNIRFQSQSVNFLIENKCYSARIRRVGGHIKEFKKSTGEIALVGQQYLATTDHQEISPVFDENSGCRIFEQNGELHCRFLARYSSRSFNAWRKFAVVEHVFNDSAAMSTSWKLIDLYNSIKVDFSDVRLKTILDITCRSEQTGNNSVAIKPRNSEEVLFVLSDIRGCSIKAKNNFIELIQEFPAGFAASVNGGFILSAGKEAINGAPAIARLDFSDPIRNCNEAFSFESFYNAYTVGKECLSLAFPQLSNTPSFWCMANIAKLCRVAPYKGEVCVKICGGTPFDNPWNARYLVSPLPLQKIKAGRHFLSLAVKAGETCPPSSAVTLRLIGSAADGSREIHTLLNLPVSTGKSDWQTVKVPFALTEDIYAPRIHIDASQTINGIVWVDDFQIVSE